MSILQTRSDTEAYISPSELVCQKSFNKSAAGFEIDLVLRGRVDKPRPAVLPARADIALRDPALCLKPPVAETVTGLSALSRVDRSHVLYWQGEAAGKDIEIVEGVARAVHLCESGARQILAFFWPGTVISPSAGRLLCYTVETVTPCLFRIPPPDRAEAGPRTIGTDEHVLGELVHLLHGISRRCALSRVAWFLLRVREHLPCCGSEPEVLKLAVPRLDIADHLGLSLETVSRCLTELKGRGIIELPNRKTIIFLKEARLKRIANR